MHMRTSQTIGALASSLALANTQIKNPNLDSVNPHFKNRYASLGAILNAIRVPFAAQGLTLVQSINTDNGMVSVETTVMHTSGEFIAETVSMPFPERATVQTLGSICTYLRRYSAAAIAGIVGEEDEDGEQDRQDRTSSPAKPVPALAKSAPAPRPIESTAQALAMARPVGTVEAVKEPARSAPADKYPDNWEGKAVVLRVAERKNKPVAIQIDGEHGTAWITTDVPEFVTLAKDAGEGTLELSRVNGTLTIMRWRQPNVTVPAPTTELPF
jgi:hypothetical protein